MLLIKDEDISNEIFKQAFDVTENIDPKDTIYLAPAISLDALFCTGDFKLLRGLKWKGFNQIITTLNFELVLKGLW